MKLLKQALRSKSKLDRPGSKKDTLDDETELKRIQELKRKMYGNG